MSDQYDHARQWHPPSPFVTHADMGPVHAEIGALKKGHEHILTTYSHLRGEMLQGFETLERVVKQSAQAQQSAAKSEGITLSLREAILGVVAIGGGAMILTYMAMRQNEDIGRAASQAIEAANALP